MIKLTVPILLFTFSGFVFSQISPLPVNPKYSPLPAKDFFAAVLAQPDSPLRLENPRMLLNLSTNRVEYFWDARNVGSKSIVAYQVEEWWINGTGGTMTNDLKRPLLKDKVSQETVDANHIIPLTDERREKLIKDAHNSRLVVFVVKSVKFSDGSYFVDSRGTDSVLNYFRNVGDCKMFD